MFQSSTKVVSSALSSPEEPQAKGRITSGGVNPFERLMSKKMVPEKTSHSFTMTIRDYWTNPLPVQHVSTPVALVEKTVQIPKPKAEPATLSLPNRANTSGSEVDKIIAETSQKYGVSEKLVRSIIRAESGGNPGAKSHAGAMGLMQLMPGTAKDLGIKNPYDIRENIDGGVRYFKMMLDRFGQDERRALAAYNAGPGAVERYGGVPPYPETRTYVTRVLRYFSEA